MGFPILLFYLSYSNVFTIFASIIVTQMKWT